ncbi:hypothetical protein QQF64_024627 [Cirrhinus molitorella]|uniref:Uncharacterized protein n=1 Tax=Cirrhinus molitorella TaxID=172907 RepID=A0ABR3NM26_9TELE
MKKRSVEHCLGLITRERCGSLAVDESSSHRWLSANESDTEGALTALPLCPAARSRAEISKGIQRKAFILECFSNSSAFEIKGTPCS